MKDITDIPGVTRDVAGRLFFDGRRLYADDDPIRNPDGTLKPGVNQKYLVEDIVYFHKAPVKITRRRR